MKLRLSELRNIIRNVISEAPLSDVDPVIFPGKSQYKFGDEDWHEENNDVKKVQKLFTSPGYKNLAIKNYKNLGTEIHIVGLPIPTYLPDERLKIVPTSKIKSFLKRKYDGFELSEEIMDRLIGYAEAGHGVIIAATRVVVPGFSPTPWMIVHAICDTEDDNPLSSLGRQICSEDYLEPEFEMPYDVFKKSLTMKSARSGQLESMRDAAAEIITQEILTTAGFTYNPTGNPEYDEKLESIKALLKDENPRKKFDDMIRGKMVIVEIY